MASPTWSRDQNYRAFREMDTSGEGVVSADEFVLYHMAQFADLDGEEFAQVVRLMSAALEVRLLHLGLTDKVSM